MGSLLVLYVWKELRAAGLFCLCFLVCLKLEQLQSESSGRNASERLQQVICDTMIKQTR